MSVASLFLEARLAGVENEAQLKDDLVWNYYVKPVVRGVVGVAGLDNMATKIIAALSNHGTPEDIRNEVIWSGVKVAAVLVAPGIAASYFTQGRFTLTGVAVGAVAPSLPLAYYGWKIKNEMSKPRLVSAE